MLTQRGTTSAAGRCGGRLMVPKPARMVASLATGPNKGLGLLELTGALLPQGPLVVGAKAGWKFAWQTMVRELAPQDDSGQYVRQQAAFQARIGTPDFPAESGRYHLYVGNACPWCHRVLLVLALKGLGAHVSHTMMADVPEEARRGGWVFRAASPDPVYGAKDLWEVYDKASPGYKGRCTAPMLIDKKTRRIVANSSPDIVRMLNDMNPPGSSGVDLCPPQLTAAIDAMNDRLYGTIQNGVYKSGFSTSQAAYDRVQADLWGAMDEVEGLLARQRFLVGDRFTEADLRLFPAIVRFDAVYSWIFKCGRRRIMDGAAYPNIGGWARDVWQLRVPGSGMQVPNTVDVDGCRQSYATSLFPLNPGQIIPAGPTAADLRLDAPHGRGDSRDWRKLFHMKQPAEASTSAGALRAL